MTHQTSTNPTAINTLLYEESVWAFNLPYEKDIKGMLALSEKRETQFTLLLLNSYTQLFHIYGIYIMICKLYIKNYM